MVIICLLDYLKRVEDINLSTERVPVDTRFAGYRYGGLVLLMGFIGAYLTHGLGISINFALESIDTWGLISVTIQFRYCARLHFLRDCWDFAIVDVYIYSCTS
jgi:hypothetical protein